jgi:hypothetical protein
MRFTIKKIQRALGDEKPTVALFDAAVAAMTEKEAAKFRKEMYRFSFSHWREMPASFRRFFRKLFIHDRGSLLNYLLKETPLGVLRYELRLPKLLLKVLHVLEIPKKSEGKRLSYRHLAFSLSLVFNYNFSLNTLSEYLGEATPDTTEILQLSGKLPIEDAY